MQPYFYPYAGYFRLMLAADTFVVLDDVQFPRRGRVHRSEISPGRWLTLPLARQPRETLIRDLRFAEGARATFDRRLNIFESMRKSPGPAREPFMQHLRGPLSSVADYLEAGLTLTAKALRLPATLVRSSSIGIDLSVRRQDRIIAIVRALGGDAYVNAPGGIDLYQADSFKTAGIDLRFLTPYTGRFFHILPELLEGDLEALRADMCHTCTLQ